MQTQEWTYVDKSNWGEGPWQSEFDKRQWVDEATGLPCLIVRGPSGALCGYVGVSKEHPYYEKDYSDRVPCANRSELKVSSPIAAIVECGNDEDGYCSLDCIIEVHGGLTFSDHCCPKANGEPGGICHIVDDGEDDNVWWLGFDCAHAWDFCPSYYRNMLREMSDAIGGSGSGDMHYRDVAYVENEIRNLARQLMEVSATA